VSVATLLHELQRARDLGFLGRAAVDAQLAHARALLAAVPEECGSGLSLLDLGSGGGLPGLAAVELPRFSRIILLDRSERRCAFLRSSLAALPETTHVEVVTGLAEHVGRDREFREGVDVVMSRSFGPPSATLECASAFVRVGGRLIVSDPPGGRNWPENGAGCFGLAVSSSSAVEPSWTVFQKTDVLDDRFPRRAGVPVRRPMFHV